MFSCTPPWCKTHAVITCWHGEMLKLPIKNNESFTLHFSKLSSFFLSYFWSNVDCFFTYIWKQTHCPLSLVFARLWGKWKYIWLSLWLSANKGKLFVSTLKYHVFVSCICYVLHMFGVYYSWNMAAVVRHSVSCLRPGRCSQQHDALTPSRLGLKGICDC